MNFVILLYSNKRDMIGLPRIRLRTSLEIVAIISENNPKSYSDSQKVMLTSLNLSGSLFTESIWKPRGSACEL